MNNDKKELLKYTGKECIRDIGIENINILKIIEGEDNFILEIRITKQIYYFKFFQKPNIKKLESEVKFVKFLRDNNIVVPSFYEKNKKILFYNKENDIAFYATEKIEGNNKFYTNYRLVEKIIDRVCEMHNVILNINLENLELQEETDKERLIEFYNKNSSFIIKNNLKYCIDIVKEIEAENKITYPIHSDLYFKNIIFNNNKIKGFIDFSDIRKTYIEEDLGKLFQNLLCSHSFNIIQIDGLIKKYKERDVYINK